MVILRGIIGVLFLTAGSYVGYYATHPINPTALIIAAGLFTTGGLIIDVDNVGKALVRLGQLRISLPFSSNLPSDVDDKG